MKSSSPKLPLTHKERAHLLYALATFQTIPSIGPRAAQWMLDLGYYSLNEIKEENGFDLVNRLEEHYGYWMDPCVEDALRCIVYHANNPNSERGWFDFTEERKTYRAQYGYPAGRPSLAWYDVNK